MPPTLKEFFLIESDDLPPDSTHHEDDAPRGYKCRCGCGCKQMNYSSTGSYCNDCDAGDCPSPCRKCRVKMTTSDSGMCGTCRKSLPPPQDDDYYSDDDYYENEKLVSGGG